MNAAEESTSREVHGTSGPVCSREMADYFSRLSRMCGQCYEVGRSAREKGFDPETFVEIPPAEDLASRVENLVGPPGIAEKIRELTASEDSREMVAILIAKHIVDTGEFSTNDKAIDQAVRTGLAIITEGVLVAPLEGVSDVSVRYNDDGTDYIRISFAGPIRSAGGTGQALGVLIADIVRRGMGISSFRVREDEVERYKEEFHLRKASQYKPKDEEIENIARNCAICIDGEGTEKAEVSGYRNLERIETNQVRGGMCLVISEGLCQKAKKIKKFVDKLGIEGWDFITGLIKEEAEEVGKEASGIYDFETDPKVKYLRDVIAGRPVFSLPSAAGGFRLRYGRGRTCGLASIAVHPATMHVLNDFLAIGTQIKIEYPGKAGAITPCDSIDGPIVDLYGGDLVQIETAEKALEMRRRIKRIIDLGEILIPFGEFAENNHPLLPPSFSDDWWMQALARKLVDRGFSDEEAENISGKLLSTNFRNSRWLSLTLDIPLNPRFNLFWHDISPDSLHFLAHFLAERAEYTGEIVQMDREGVELNASALERMAEDGEEKGLLTIPVSGDPEFGAAREILCALGALHRKKDKSIVLDRYAEALVTCLGLKGDGKGSVALLDGWEATPGEWCAAEDGEKSVCEWGTGKNRKYEDEKHYLANHDNRYWGESLRLLYDLSGIRIYPRAPTRVGARMGRPEKANERKMKPPVHSLFPVAKGGGDRRSMKNANEMRRFTVEVGRRICPGCGDVTHEYTCARCGLHTERKDNRLEKREIDFYTLYGRALHNLKMGAAPETKGVKGLISKYKTPEPIEKGLLRSKNGVYVFKDGTIRFDMTDVPLTHFRPAEVHTPVEKLRELGYKKDIHGRELVNDHQMLEIKVQDIIVSRNCITYLYRTAMFVDELLERFYKMDRFYNLKVPSDILGHLVVGLAPHTSGGVLARVVGFSDARVGYAHPYFHAAKRRNCLPGDTEVMFANGASATLEELFEGAVGPGRMVDDVGTEMRDVEMGEVLTLGASGGPLRTEKIKNVIRTPSPNHWIEITTRGGRHITASPYHQVCIHKGRNDQISKMRAHSVKVGDGMVVPGRIDLAREDADRIDLLGLLSEIEVPDVMIRNTNGWMRETIRDMGGYRNVGDSLGIGWKTLTNYVYRDSFPLDVAGKIIALSGRKLTDLPHDVKLAAKRDTVEMKRFLVLGEEFCRFLGYYLAEGFCRVSKGSFYQVSLSSSEDDIKEDMVRCIVGAFGTPPSVRGNVITLSGRLISSLVRDIWKLGSGAHEKRIPGAFRRLPRDRMAQLLKAYIAGDGSVEKGRLTVKITSANLDLLRDVQLQLKRFSIHSKFRHERRRGGGAVRDHYTSRGREPPFFNSHALIMRSTDARLLHDRVGIASKRKITELRKVLPRERGRRTGKFGDHFIDPVSKIRMVPNRDPHVYDIEVANTHSFLTEDLLVTSNCDGDEDCIMLLLDGLLNFSKSYLPGTIGGQMDAPLVLSTRLDPSEIDKEAHNIDCHNRYPLEFYEAALRQESPKAVDGIMDKVEGRLATDFQYEGFGFTHDTKDISEGVTTTAYKTLDSMDAKITGQLKLATMIRAVSDTLVAAKVIETHFMPDMMGNMNAFSRQKMKCRGCGASYRRPPLGKVCSTCGNDINLTVHRGMVEKYIKTSKKIAERYDLPEYTKQRIELIEKSLNSLFNNDKVKQTGLWDFC